MKPARNVISNAQAQFEQVRRRVPFTTNYAAAIWKCGADEALTRLGGWEDMGLLVRIKVYGLNGFIWDVISDSHD